MNVTHVTLTFLELDTHMNYSFLMSATLHALGPLGTLCLQRISINIHEFVINIYETFVVINVHLCDAVGKEGCVRLRG